MMSKGRTYQPSMPVTLPISSWSEEQLLEAAIDFNEAALAEIYDRYEARIYTYIYRRTGEQSLAEDLAAQVFMKMLQAIRDRKTWHSSFSGWLYRIAHNLIIDYYRQRDRHHQVELDDTLELVSESDDPVRSAEHRQTADKLRFAMRQLTEEQAEVVNLRFLDGFSISEVATMMNKTEGAIKALQYRAVMTLRTLLEHEQLHR